MADFGSLVTGNDPAMWDEWLKKIASQMTQEPDKKAPLSTGLMAAGLGMLANANRGFAGGVGAGGLLGLNAYNEALAAQKKDPMQQLQMMSAVSGIQERMRDQKMQQEFQSAIMGGQPQQMAPQYGMQDRSMGEMPQAAPMASGNGPALAVLEKYLANPKLATAAEKLIKHYYPDTKMGPGDVLMRGDQKIAENPDPTKPVIGPDGRVNYRPGYQESVAGVAGATKGAEAAASAPYTPVQTFIGKTPTTTTVDKLGGPPPGELEQAYADYLRSPNPNNLPFTYQPSARVGVGVPPDVQAAATEKAKQDALTPGEIQKNLAQKFNESDLAERAAAMTKAQTAMEANTTLANVRQLSTGKDAARGGMMAPTLQSLDAFMNGIGIPFNAAQFKSTEEAQTYLAGLSMAQVKAMVGSNAISDRDVIAVKAMMPQIANNPAVRLRLLDTLEKANNRSIEFADRINKHLRQHKTLDNFDYGLKQSEQQPAAQSQREAVEAEMRKRGIRF